MTVTALVLLSLMSNFLLWLDSHCCLHTSLVEVLTLPLSNYGTYVELAIEAIVCILAVRCKFVIEIILENAQSPISKCSA